MVSGAFQDAVCGPKGDEEAVVTDLTSLSGLIDTYRTLSVEQLLDRDLIVRFLRLAHALGAREMAQEGVERLSRLTFELRV